MVIEEGVLHVKIMKIFCACNTIFSSVHLVTNVIFLSILIAIFIIQRNLTIKSKLRTKLPKTNRIMSSVKLKPMFK